MQSSGNRELATAAQRTADPRRPPHEFAAFEGYLVDRRRWLITHDGDPIPLKRKAFDLLLYLLDHRDEVVDKDTLMRAVWGNLIVEESNVTQQVFLLRKALSRHESGMKIIETVPGRGYRFVPSLDFPSQEPGASQIYLRAHSSRVTMTISEESEDEPGPAVVVEPAIRSTSRHGTGLIAAACALFALGGYGLRCWQEQSAPIFKAFATLQGAGERETPPMRADGRDKRY
jgi:DNA-binding winged helix-turn-helix (wHTH) protein